MEFLVIQITLPKQGKSNRTMSTHWFSLEGLYAVFRVGHKRSIIECKAILKFSKYISIHLIVTEYYCQLVYHHVYEWCLFVHFGIYMFLHCWIFFKTRQRGTCQKHNDRMKCLGHLYSITEMFFLMFAEFLNPTSTLYDNLRKPPWPITPNENLIKNILLQTSWSTFYGWHAYHLPVFALHFAVSHYSMISFCKVKFGPMLCRFSCNLACV